MWPPRTSLMLSRWFLDNAVIINRKAEQDCHLFVLFQGVWLSLNRDLEEAKSNIEVCAIMIISDLKTNNILSKDKFQELFYLLPMDSESERRTLLSLVIIGHTLIEIHVKTLEENYSLDQITERNC